MERRKRSDIGPRITDRDTESLQWIGQQYAISLDHLTILLARLRSTDLAGAEPNDESELSANRTMRIVRRWAQMGLVEHRKFIHGEPTWVWLTALGLKLIAPDVGELRSHTPDVAKIEHLYWCNHTRLYIEQQPRKLEWQSERLLRVGQKTEPGRKLPHTPDAAITLENGNRVAVEVELSSKTYSRLEKILLELALEYHTTWYFTQGRAEQVIKNALDKLGKQYSHKFVIYPLDDTALK